MITMRAINKIVLCSFTIFISGYIPLKPVLGLQVFQQRVVVNSSELCIIPITPTQLGWEKKPGSVKEIEYSARMSGSPDLPEWLKYTYDSFTSTGYIYGVPPMRLVTLNLDVIGWNRYDNYDVRQLIVSLEIMRKEPVEYVMEMKIDNLNIRDLCIPRRMNDLRNILAEHLGWRQKNGNRVNPIYMASAVDIGENRVPLRPNEGEGVVIHFGSDKDFSPALKKVLVEISPLWKLRPCPRDMKRTSVERYFRRSSFLVDWCSFQLSTLGAGPTNVIEDQHQNKKGTSQKMTSAGSSLSNNVETASAIDETVEFVTGKGRYLIEPEVFQFEYSIPERSYTYEALLATLVPGSIGGLIGIVLIALLWADREDESVDGDRLFFEAAFRMLFSIIRYNNGNGNGAATYAYHQINRPQQQDEAMLISRDVIIKPEPILETQMAGASASQLAMDREMMSTPMPPQYSETHPNGTPALIYAV